MNEFSMKKRIKELNVLQNNIKIRFNDPHLLNRAFTHRSYANENRIDVKDNERLEYLGDSVLALIVNEYLFKRYEQYREGNLAKIKSSVVSEGMLSQIAAELSLGNYLLLGKGEENTGGRNRQSILANTVEALIGAIYLDRGLRETKRFVLHMFKKHISMVDRIPTMRDPKTTLQELVQKKYKEKPEYLVIEESGPDHNRVFVIELIIHGKVCSTGRGSSKRKAEIDAAKTVLMKLNSGSFDL